MVWYLSLSWGSLLPSVPFLYSMHIGPHLEVVEVLWILRSSRPCVTQVLFLPTLSPFSINFFITCEYSRKPSYIFFKASISSIFSFLSLSLFSLSFFFFSLNLFLIYFIRYFFHLNFQHYPKSLAYPPPPPLPYPLTTTF